MLESTGVPLKAGHEHSSHVLKITINLPIPSYLRLFHSVSFSLSPLRIELVLQPRTTGDPEPAALSYCGAPTLNPRKTAPPEGSGEILPLIFCSSSPRGDAG